MDYKPPLEHIRQGYYHEVRKFVNIPNSFEGFGNSAIYKKMGSNNSMQLIQIFGKAEALFDKLSVLLTRYLPWVRLGQVDMDRLVETKVVSVDEFLANFKGLRVKRKDIEKLPDVEKIGCITISLIPLKSQLDDLMNRFNDILLLTLRRSLLTEFKEVDSYLEFANERLSSRPHSVEEIGNAKKTWKEIDSKKDTMKALSKAAVEKKKLLFQYVSGSAIDVSEVSTRMTNLDGEGGRWDDFDIALEAFNDMIEEQKEALKGTLDEEGTCHNFP